MRNKHTNKTVRSVERRKVSVFPTMEFCNVCNQYTETRCNHEQASSGHTFKTYFDMWLHDKGFHVAIPDFVFSNNQIC